MDFDGVSLEDKANFIPLGSCLAFALLHSCYGSEFINFARWKTALPT